MLRTASLSAGNWRLRVAHLHSSGQRKPPYEGGVQVSDDLPNFPQHARLFKVRIKATVFFLYAV